jgi:hypothetical protein
MALPVLLILAAWIVVLWFVVALCLAARLGEQQRRRQELPEVAREQPHAIAARSPVETAHGRGPGYSSGATAQAAGVTS